MEMASAYVYKRTQAARLEVKTAAAHVKLDTITCNSAVQAPWEVGVLLLEK